MESCIRLFKALPIKMEATQPEIMNSEIMEKTIRRGFIFSPELHRAYSVAELIKLSGIIEKEIGLTPEKMNQTFHKSWGKVRDASMLQLFFEQIMHYFTTYGFEEMGIYDKDSVYIPNEKLEIPELKVGQTKIVIIRGYTKAELKQKALELLQTGIALKDQTVKDIIDISLFVSIDENDIDSIKNRETKAALYGYLNILPKDPTEFLRYCIYMITGKTLLIKDLQTIEAIKEGTNPMSLTLFNRYKTEYGLEALAQIFYRFKPLFLAFKPHNRSMKTIINKIRKLAPKNHTPMKTDFLNEVTARLNRGEKINEKDLNIWLSYASNFRKIRLAYALNFRAHHLDSILYRIRNGKGYAKEFQFYPKAIANEFCQIVLQSIAENMNINGKRVFIPENIHYALPATEKQFTGDLPSGTYVSIPHDMVFGIHWENTDNQRVDLDLSLINADIGKIGWDSSYRTEDRSILFSGDITDAPLPKGATELFYVSKQNKSAFIMMVNFYNYQNNNESIPLKILVAHELPERFNQNYMVNPNNIEAITKTDINKKQKVLGLLTVTDEECRFYFTEAYLGNSITSYGNSFAEHARKYLVGFYTNTIDLAMVLRQAGAIMTKDTNCDFDLSPNNVEKGTIINLFV